MIRVSEFVGFLEQQFPGTKFYNGSINKADSKCAGVYLRGSGKPRIALGGIENTSYSVLPISILVHWTEDSDECEAKANEVYAALFGANDQAIGGKRVIMFQMLDPCPISVQRDEKNIVEMVIRLNILYEREEM